jgi:WD40 repeat protein
VRHWLSHANYVWSVAFSPDGQHIGAGTDDKLVILKMWSVYLAGRRPLRRWLRRHTVVVFSVAFSPDGQHIVSGSGDKFG